MSENLLTKLPSFMRKLLYVFLYCQIINIAIAQPVPDTFSSNLPIVIIDTRGQEIPNEPKINADIKIIDRPNRKNHIKDSLFFKTAMAIERRGSSSQIFFPQQSYSIKFIDSLGEEVNHAVMGMPEEHDWIMYAPYNDKTCMRNVLSYALSNRMGMYASRTQFCELVLNGDYMGLYVWMEKIKRDKNRVDIAKLLLTDIEGEELTGGYIFKIDKVNSNFGGGWYSNFLNSVGKQMLYQYEYPNGRNIQAQQEKFIQAYVDSFERALQSSDFMDSLIGYRQFISVPSFIDYFLLNELSRNVDGYRISTFLYKDKSKKLRIGPPWDYNLAWWNANYCEGFSPMGWAYRFNEYCGGDPYPCPFWWDRLAMDSTFNNQLTCRYQELRKTVFHEDSIFQLIDSFANIISESHNRHFLRWPVMGQYVWPNPSPIPQSYEAEIKAIKLFITRRLNWLDNNMPGTCRIISEVSDQPYEFPDHAIFPNPFTNELLIRVMGDKAEITISDSNGKVILSTCFQGPNNILNLISTSWAPGLYFIQIKEKNISRNYKCIKMH